MFVDKLKSYNIVIGILSLEILLATLSVVWIYNIYEDFGYITFVTFILQFVSIILMLLFVHSADDLYKYVIISVISSSGSGLFMFFMQENMCSCIWSKTTSETFKTDYDRVFDNNRCNYLYQFRYNNSWMADGRLSCWNLRNSSQNLQNCKTGAQCSCGSCHSKICILYRNTGKKIRYYSLEKTD